MEDLTNLFDQIMDAPVVIHDHTSQRIMIWNGHHSVNCYDYNGIETDHWTMGLKDVGIGYAVDSIMEHYELDREKVNIKR